MKRTIVECVRTEYSLLLFFLFLFFFWMPYSELCNFRKSVRFSIHRPLHGSVQNQNCRLFWLSIAKPGSLKRLVSKLIVTSFVKPVTGVHPPFRQANSNPSKPALLFTPSKFPIIKFSKFIEK